MLASLSLVAVGSALANPQQSAPYVPANDTTVLETLPSTSDPRVRQFEVLKNQLQAQPNDPNAAVALANAYLDYGRDTGDARYLGRAEAVIRPWLAKRPAPDDAIVVEATILQSRHQFADARQRLESMVARNRDNPQTWLVLSSIYLIQGDMDDAKAACRHVLPAGALVTAGCIGAWSAVNGNAREALDSVETILGDGGDQSPALLAWGHGLMADAASYLGQTDRADAEFRQALQFAPGDNFLLADYADFLLHNGRAQEALTLTRGYSQSDTSFLRQVLAEAALGLPEAQADIATMASRFSDLEQRGDSHLYAREEARFVLEMLHDPQRALELARNNWSNQRAPEDARIYLQAALAADKPEAAVDVIGFLDRTGLEDPTIRTLAARVSARTRAKRAPVAEPSP